MKTALAVGLGSAVGGVLRYLLSSWVQIRSRTGFPYGTLLVNIAGCLAIGIIVSLAERQLISREWRLYLATGLLGGFTTFSAFSLETVTLLREGRVMPAVVYAALSLLFGCLATYAGVVLGRAGS